MPDQLDFLALWKEFAEGTSREIKRLLEVVQRLETVTNKNEKDLAVLLDRQKQSLERQNEIREAGDKITSELKQTIAELKRETIANLEKDTKDLYAGLDKRLDVLETHHAKQQGGWAAVSPAIKFTPTLLAGVLTAWVTSLLVRGKG